VLQKLIFKRTLRLNDSSIFYASSNPNHFPEHSVPKIKISIPLGKASFQAFWQTSAGQRKQKHVRSGHICVLPANLPHEVVLESKQEMINIDFEPAFIEQIAEELTGKNVEIIEK
jgi:AraC family transcriptional regulator